MTEQPATSKKKEERREKREERRRRHSIFFSSGTTESHKGGYKVTTGGPPFTSFIRRLTVKGTVLVLAKEHRANLGEHLKFTEKEAGSETGKKKRRKRKRKRKDLSPPDRGDQDGRPGCW